MNREVTVPKKVKPTINTKHFRKGSYRPENHEKYLGDINKIVYRSSWELHAFQFLDRNPNILKWGSEIIPIHYMKPVSKAEDPRGWRRAIYFPDLYVEYVNRKGAHVRELIEIKPEKQTKPSKARKEWVRLQENYQYAVNRSKWHFAQEWCKENGINFVLCTEKDLFKN